MNLRESEYAELLEFLRCNLSFSAKRELYERFLCENSTELEADLLKSDDEMVRTLVQDGISSSIEVLTGSEVDAIMDYLANEKCLPGHVSDEAQANEGMSLNEAFSHSNFATYSVSQILNAPHLLKSITSEKIIGVARKYLGHSPIFSDMLLFWAKPGRKINLVNQAFHRDEDDIKFLSLFIYLTDINGDDDGPHAYLKGTHNSRKMKEYFANVINKKKYSRLDKLLFGITAFVEGVFRGYKYLGYGNNFLPKISFHEFVNSHKLHPVYDKVMSDLDIKIFGERGTGFFADVGGFHKGVMPKSKPRLVFSARFAVTDACVSRLRGMNFELSGIKKEELDQDVFKYLV